MIDYNVIMYANLGAGYCCNTAGQHMAACYTTSPYTQAECEAACDSLSSCVGYDYGRADVPCHLYFGTDGISDVIDSAASFLPELTPRRVNGLPAGWSCGNSHILGPMGPTPCGSPTMASNCMKKTPTGECRRERAPPPSPPNTRV